MNQSDNPFSFSVVTGSTVDRVLRQDLARVVSVVEQAYLAHDDEQSVNPPSLFLRFPDNPDARIIALLADLRAGFGVSGMKWIASYPSNIEQGIPRASAVLVLNRRDTGYPFAVMEASIISAARTAASAALGAEKLGRPDKKAASIGFVGCGLIARYILDMMMAAGWSFGGLSAFDLRSDSSSAFLEHAGSVHRLSTRRAESAEALLRGNDLVVLTTTAGQPYLHDVSLLAHRPLVLNISLRDLSPEIILASNNVVDDVDHCLKANTSPHLAEQKTGRRDFINGTIAGVIRNRAVLDPKKPTVYSPFGMGILDIALGKYVYDKAQAAGELLVIDDFFHERKRW
ncbi:2,3-diaminopropionate biosynthesis protein SbnB [Archangium sp.]|uniref:2,3-diaminopropionate biosynthesis protein SbnB n=1 Tax=Archangium sp. TaxID=1872627 RepID=UPI0032C21F6D